MKVLEKVIVVSGAGSGIGRDLVLNLLAKGAYVAGVDLNAKSLAETMQLTGGHPDRFHGFEADITNLDLVDKLPGQVVSKFGRVDGIINNAGIIQPFIRLNDLDYGIIERVLNVNLRGTIYMTKAFLPHLLGRPEGHIANLSSMGGFVPVPGQTIYCAAKAAVKLLSEGLAAELLSTQVRVTVVCPGAVATNIRENSGVATPSTTTKGKQGNALSAQDAAEIIVRGIERNAYHVFVGKDAKLIDKIYRISPAFAARAIAKKMSTLLPDQR